MTSSTVLPATRSELVLGMPVRFTHRLYRGSERRPSDVRPNDTVLWKVWRTLPLWRSTDQDGIIVGARTLHNGVVTYGYYDEPTTFVSRERFRAYLIAYDLWRSFELVLPEHIEIL